MDKTTSPYTETFLKTRRVLVGADMSCPSPGECEAWLGAERTREFWPIADDLDAEIYAYNTLLDPLTLPPICSVAERMLLMEKLTKRLARHRRNYETFFVFKVKNFTWRKLRRANRPRINKEKK